MLSTFGRSYCKAPGDSYSECKVQETCDREKYERLPGKLFSHEIMASKFMSSACIKIFPTDCFGWYRMKVSEKKCGKSSTYTCYLIFYIYLLWSMLYIDCSSRILLQICKSLNITELPFELLIVRAIKI